MRDLLDILAAYHALPPTEPATLATVVRVQGSAYRLPGARMLIDAAGRRVGSVSGGCLEADVARRGRLLSATSPNQLIRYDGADDADTAWNYALGCDGAIEVFIERLPPSQRPDAADSGPAPLPPFPGTPGDVSGIGDCPRTGPGEGDFEREGPLAEQNHPHPSPLPAYRERGSDGAPASLEFVRHCIRHRTAGVLLTVFAAPPGAAPPPGTRLMLVAHDPVPQEPFTPLPPDPLRAAILTDAHTVLATGQTTTITYQTAAGPVHALVESIRPPLPLIICGAGHDAVPLVDAGKSLGWHVTVADRRAGYARPERFPLADLVIAADFSAADPASELPIPPGAAVVIMTHHYPDDRALLERALRSTAAYIGVLGPRARTQRMLAELATQGLSPTPQQLARLHAPIGLDLGAEGPGPVALSIVAEILAVTNHRPGTPLHQRDGPIHAPASTRIVSAIDVAGVDCSMSAQPVAGTP